MKLKSEIPIENHLEIELQIKEDNRKIPAREEGFESREGVEATVREMLLDFNEWLPICPVAVDPDVDFAWVSLCSVVSEFAGKNLLDLIWEEEFLVDVDEERDGFIEWIELVQSDSGFLLLLLLILLASIIVFIYLLPIAK